MRVDFDELQAHVVLGFGQSSQRLLFFRLKLAAAFKARGAQLTDAITWTGPFLRAGGAKAWKCSTDPRPQLGLALAHRGLQQLAPAEALRWFGVPRYAATGPLTLYGTLARGSAFTQDCAARSNAVLMDEIDAHARWLVGGTQTTADGVLIIGATTDAAALACSKGIRSELDAAIEVVHEEAGSRLSGSREHFGFPDGGAVPIALLEDATLGSLRQHVPRATQCYEGHTLLLSRAEHADLPELATHGSFLAFRRLRQDVFGFHSAVRDAAGRLGSSADEVAARIYGIDETGAPLIPGGVNSDDFDYSSDPDGQRCPFSAHIRRANPRNAQNPRPLFRRSVPYGEASASTWLEPRRDDVDRGLLFLCYQSSLEAQFEYVSSSWLNSTSADRPIDALLGRRTGQPGRRDVALGAGRVVLPDFATATGGGYFFAPSRAGLRELLQ